MSTLDVETETALAALLGDEPTIVTSLTVRGGYDKAGDPESCAELTFRAGEVTCIVGPTGSGKSRLLADIEWLAQRDTPTGRSVLINGELPDLSGRYAGTGRLVAQLSQNMNFVMDATVGAFLDLHAESRGIDLDATQRARIVDSANRLTGEPIREDRQLTELSGGQSRALMIADTALLSSSPIVLIDEIENAGIDRHAAIALLRGADKIVLIATHDPSLALSAERRVVIGNGAITSVLERSDREREIAAQLRVFDSLQEELRTALRSGRSLDSVDTSFVETIGGKA
ncbi:MAG TPA: ATP-binding cassette domain-containing protein [Spirochaetia bacterium]|nr:ATP-binding cassette domain-containing protein [Spirochaetia bacterium]